MNNTKCQRCGEMFDGRREVMPPEARPGADGRHTEPTTICSKCTEIFKEERLIWNVLEDLGDNFTSQQFSEAMHSARAAEPKPDTYIEYDEAEIS